MPLYDYWCPCGYLEDDVFLRRGTDTHTCPSCGNPAERVPPVAHPSGIIWSNERVLPGDQGVVRSNAELRRREAQIEARGFVPVSKNDAAFQRKRERALDAANGAAQKLGFKDHFHRSEVARKERNKG